MSADPLAATTIPALVEAAAATFGSRVAIEDGAVQLTFAALAAETRRAARAFLAAGVAHGDRVAIWAPNRWEWIVAATGLQAAGAVLVPLNTRFKGREAGYVLRKSRARVLVTVGEFLGIALRRVAARRGAARTRRASCCCDGAAEDPRAQSWSDVPRRRRGRVGRARLPSAPRASRPTISPIILFTSGTTGAPKGVMTTHGQNLRAFAAWSEGVGLRAGDRYLVVNPFFHSFGYKAGWLACLLRGATILPHAVFDVAAVFARIARERISVLPGPPSLYQSILAHPECAQCRPLVAAPRRDGRGAGSRRAGPPHARRARLRDGAHRLRAHRVLRRRLDVPSRATTRRRSPRRRAARSPASRCAASTTRATRCRAANRARSWCAATT